MFAIRRLPDNDELPIFALLLYKFFSTLHFSEDTFLTTLEPPPPPPPPQEEKMKQQNASDERNCWNSKRERDRLRARFKIRERISALSHGIEEEQLSLLPNPSLTM